MAIALNNFKLTNKIVELIEEHCKNRKLIGMEIDDYEGDFRVKLFFSQKIYPFKKS